MFVDSVKLLLSFGHDSQLMELNGVAVQGDKRAKQCDATLE